MFHFSERDVNHFIYDEIIACPFKKFSFHNLVLYGSFGACELRQNNDCFIGIRNGISYHVFKKIDMSHSSDSHLLLDYIYGDKKSYYDFVQYERGEYYFRCRLNLLYDYIFNKHDSAEDIKATIVKTLDIYFNNLLISLRLYGYADCKQQLHLPPKDIFDSVVINKSLFPLKLVKILPAYVDFFGQMRECMFEFVHKYCKENIKKLEKNTNVEIKESITCSIKNFKNLTIFKCHKKNCDNVVFFEKFCKENDLDNVIELPPLPDNTRICSHLLQLVYDNIGSNAKIQKWGFKCQFESKSSRIPDKYVTKSYLEIFGRRDPIHRNCVPEKYLGIDWLNWLLKTDYKC